MERRAARARGVQYTSGLIKDQRCTTHRTHRRIVRGFRNRDNYRVRMLLIAVGLTQPNPGTGALTDIEGDWLIEIKEYGYSARGVDL